MRSIIRMPMKDGYKKNDNGEIFTLYRNECFSDYQQLTFILELKTFTFIIKHT